MKKFLFALLTVLTLAGALPCYASEPIPIQFRKHGDGQFIYCNNIEFIKENNLSTVENPEASYMMNNENLQPGKYSVFFCFYNWTDFNVEPDIEFKSDTGAVITINSIGYYVPQGVEEWDCLGAWSDYLGIDIRSMGNTSQYVQYRGDTKLPATFEVKNGNEWISKYIYNYEALDPKVTFNMLVDFTIESGEADVNFAALKSYGVLGDRSMHNPNAAFGKYSRDTAIKGIEPDTLPIVESDIKVTIDKNTHNGDNYDVIVFNQCNPEGVKIPYWTTNINPNSDGSIFCRNTAADSDMLNFIYRDDSKLDYYGKNVPESERDNIWRMDINHYDTQNYYSFMPWNADDHIPNASNGEVHDINKKPQTELEFNLGNFGVTDRYNFTITNTDTVTRTLNYYIESARTSNIVIVRDEEGYPLNPYTLKREDAFALSKNLIWNVREEVCMFSAEVAPGETRRYTLDVILPTNNYGGQLNSLKADSKKCLTPVSYTPLPNYNEYKSYKRVFFNGENYMKWENKTLYALDEKGWKVISLPQKTEELFFDNSYMMSFIKIPNGYAGRYSAWDRYGWWISDRVAKNKLYIFDKKFNLTDTIEFKDYIYDMVYAQDKLYVQSDGLYMSEDMKNFQASDMEVIPQNNGYFNLLRKDGAVYELKDGKLIKIEFEGDTPWELCSNGSLYYYRKFINDYTTDTKNKNIVSVSKDGLNWYDLILPGYYLELLKLYDFNGDIVIDTKYEDFNFKMPEENTIRVQLNDTLLAFETHPEIVNSRTMVPLRFFFEKLGADVLWDDENREITVSKNGRVVKLAIDSIKATVNGEENEIDAAPYIKNERTMIPMRFLSENLGFSVDWDEDTYTASVQGNY